MTDTNAAADFVIVGGGLAGSLIALAKAEIGRGHSVTLIEQGTQLGGNHTWSFHRTDLDADGWGLVGPLVAHRWPRYEVRFPGRSRVMEGDYVSVTSERFARVVEARLALAGVRVLPGRRVRDLDAGAVHFDDGTELRGAVVVDARGPTSGPAVGRTAFQKFVGLELDLEEDGPWDVPVIMDASEDVEQSSAEGFRFVYVLPFSRRHVLIEDTVYGDDPGLDESALAVRVVAYALARGAQVRRVLRREAGVLPLPMEKAAARPPFDVEGPLRVGYGGGLFHPVTGYSLPIASRVALALAPARTRTEAQEALAAVARELAPQQSFGRLLNRLMFEAMMPARRWTALERFYRMPPATIARFYASRTTFWDRARLLVGRPPAGVSWRRLLASRMGAPS